MKYEKAIYGIGSLIIIGAAAMRILHLPYADYSTAITTWGMVGMFFFQSWQVTQLKKKIKELEQK